jgi:6-phosphogluconolactonase
LSVESNIHLHSVLPPEEVPDVETSAKRYNIDLQGINFGLVILGAGPDGHVASLFPGMWSNHETRNAIAVGQSPKPPSRRVSLTMKMINSSQRVWLLACGGNKRNLVLRIRENDLELPVNHVRGTLETVVLVDADSSPSA